MNARLQNSVFLKILFLAAIAGFFSACGPRPFQATAHPDQHVGLPQKTTTTISKDDLEHYSEQDKIATRSKTDIKTIIGEMTIDEKTRTTSFDAKQNSFKVEARVNVRNKSFDVKLFGEVDPSTGVAKLFSLLNENDPIIRGHAVCLDVTDDGKFTCGHYYINIYLKFSDQKFAYLYQDEGPWVPNPEAQAPSVEKPAPQTSETTLPQDSANTGPAHTEESDSENEPPPAPGLYELPTDIDTLLGEKTPEVYLTPSNPQPKAAPVPAAPKAQAPKKPTPVPTPTPKPTMVGRIKSMAGRIMNRLRPAPVTTEPTDRTMAAPPQKKTKAAPKTAPAPQAKPKPVAPKAEPTKKSVPAPPPAKKAVPPKAPPAKPEPKPAPKPATQPKDDDHDDNREIEDDEPDSAEAVAVAPARPASGENVPDLTAPFITPANVQAIECAFYRPRDRGGCSRPSKLANASQLDASSPFYQVQTRSGRKFGTQLMIDFITRIGKRLYTALKGYRLGILDITDRDGGPQWKDGNHPDRKLTSLSDRRLAHASHMNGLDGDIRYVLKDEDATGYGAAGIATRTGINRGKVHMDQQWDLYKAIARTKAVSQIFVNYSIKKGLCQYARERGDYVAEKETLRRLRGYSSHTSHWHLRLKCPIGALRCRNEPEPRPLGKDGRGC